MIQLVGISKNFTGADGSVEALKNVDLTIEDGDIFGIIGMSGAGKSTLVRCINMLEKPTEGSVLIDGRDICKMSPAELRRVRREVTMIFQGFNLLMQKTCLDNICLPLEFAGVKKSEARKRGMELLQTVGLPDKANAYPAQLSGGQKQRIAIARALATDPKVLLCDEATSALDPKTTHDILELIKKINEKLGITVIIITHQMSVVEEVCNNVAILDGGEVVEVGAVSDVFSSPKTSAAKSLVFPDTLGCEAARSGERRIRVVFNGSEATTSPLIAQMAIEKNIVANIISASARMLGNKMYGNMLLGVSGGDEVVQEAVKYLTAVPNVIAEEAVSCE